ncbi:MAG: hypothetical protein ACRC9F_00435 [Metamycoplasmataceae bacterium]
MSINKKIMETSIINLGQTKILISEAEKTRETELFHLGKRTSLTIDEIRTLRDQFKNKKLFSKIIANAEGSIFLTDTLTKEEQIFLDAKLLTVKQVAFFAVYYRNQLNKKSSFLRIVKNTEDSLFDNWFNIHVKYNFLIKLGDFYNKTIFSLADLKNNQSANIYESDIESERKITIKWIEKTFLKDFKAFLLADWKRALEKNEEFAEKVTKKNETIIFNT